MSDSTPIRSDPLATSFGRGTPLAVAVLAAGLGTRMKSALPKVLHPVCGRPALAYVLDAVRELGPRRLVVVTGPGDDDQVAAALPEGCERAPQAERLGSGDALKAAMAVLGDFEGDVMAINGDVPLVTPELLAGLLAQHRNATSRATITSIVLDDPGHYGRVLRRADGDLAAIVEARDASSDELAVREINVGFYVFDAGELRRLLPGLKAANDQGEYYLTDLVAAFIAAGDRAAVFATADVPATIGINTRVELAEVDRIMRARLLERLMLDGVGGSTRRRPTSTGASPSVATPCCGRRRC